jgi:hypothetical protein
MRISEAFIICRVPVYVYSRPDREGSAEAGLLVMFYWGCPPAPEVSSFGIFTTLYPA